MGKILLINPPSSLKAYSKSKIRAAIPTIPLLSLATLASPLIKDGHEVEILNLPLSTKPDVDLKRKLESFSPTDVGITFTTPLFPEAAEISRAIKNYDPAIRVIGGGAHASALPSESLRDSELDIVAVGEGDVTLPEIISSEDISSIEGIYYKNNGEIKSTSSRALIKDINNLLFPSWELYDLKKYHSPRLTSRKNPVGPIETSRGCVYGCTYCNKDIFGRRFRTKSAERVVSEIEYMLDVGFKEIHIWEDNFTIDLDRAKKICDLIVERGLDFPWNMFTGIRVDRIDREFFEKAYNAGCYSVSFGVESGNQKLLDNIKKGITLDQIRAAFKMAKDVGMETIGFFMIALPGETIETMEETIEFAIELDPDYTKVTMTLPFPSTPLFDQLEKEGRIKTRDWSKYNFHSTTEVYDHPTLDWETIQEYYDLFYRRFYFRKNYILRRIKRGMLNGNVVYDGYYFLNTWCANAVDRLQRPFR